MRSTYYVYIIRRHDCVLHVPRGRREPASRDESAARTGARPQAAYSSDLHPAGRTHGNGIVATVAAATSSALVGRVEWSGEGWVGSHACVCPAVPVPVGFLWGFSFCVRSVGGEITGCRFRWYYWNWANDATNYDHPALQLQPPPPMSPGSSNSDDDNGRTPTTTTTRIVGSSSVLTPSHRWPRCHAIHARWCLASGCRFRGIFVLPRPPNFALHCGAGWCGFPGVLFLPARLQVGGGYTMAFWKLKSFRHCSTFVCLWQILSNHGLTRIKRFVSWFTAKLYN